MPSLISVLGGKPVKAGMKQQNLFGQPVTEDPSRGSGAKGKKKPSGKEKTNVDPKKKSKSPRPDAAGGDAAKGKGSANQDTQMEDDSQALSNLDSQVQEVETQLEETQLDGSSPPVDAEVETQPTTETQTEEEETQPETQVDEDDGEPVGRSARAISCSLTDFRRRHSIRLSIGQPHHHERQRRSRSLSGELVRDFLVLATFFWFRFVSLYALHLITPNREAKIEHSTPFTQRESRAWAVSFVAC